MKEWKRGIPQDSHYAEWRYRYEFLMSLGGASKWYRRRSPIEEEELRRIDREHHPE